MTQVIEFKPKGVKRQKVTLESVLQQVTEAKPVMLVIVGADEEGNLLMFTGGQRCAEANWLLDLGKAALVGGEMSNDE